MSSRPIAVLSSNRHQTGLVRSGPNSYILSTDRSCLASGVPPRTKEGRWGVASVWRRAAHSRTLFAVAVGAVVLCACILARHEEKAVWEIARRNMSFEAERDIVTLPIDVSVFSLSHREKSVMGSVQHIIKICFSGPLAHPDCLRGVWADERFHPRRSVVIEKFFPFQVQAKLLFRSTRLTVHEILCPRSASVCPDGQESHSRQIVNPGPLTEASFYVSDENGRPLRLSSRFISTNQNVYRGDACYGENHCCEGDRSCPADYLLVEHAIWVGVGCLLGAVGLSAIAVWTFVFGRGWGIDWLICLVAFGGMAFLVFQGLPLLLDALGL